MSHANKNNLSGCLPILEWKLQCSASKAVQSATVHERNTVGPKIENWGLFE
jgi:hypothetical protein